MAPQSASPCPKCGQEVPTQIGRADGKTHVCPGCGASIEVTESGPGGGRPGDDLEEFLRSIQAQKP